MAYEIPGEVAALRVAVGHVLDRRRRRGALWSACVTGLEGASGEASGQGGARSALSPELRGSGRRAVVRQGERQREGEVRESFVFSMDEGPHM